MLFGRIGGGLGKGLDKALDLCYTVRSERSTMRDGHYTARSDFVFPFVSFWLTIVQIGV